MGIARAACFAFVALAATRRLTLVAIGLIVGRAVGTLMDRFRFGAVADFLSLARFWVLLERSIRRCGHLDWHRPAYHRPLFCCRGRLSAGGAARALHSASIIPDLARRRAEKARHR
jgi:hypothetical protein